MVKFWDAHVHLFPEPLFKAIWRWFDNVGWELPYANWELGKHVSYLKQMGMERGFLLTYAHKPDMSLGLNKWVRDICRRYPCFIPFACIHPGDSNLEQVMATLLDDWGFAGFKLQLAVQEMAASDPALDPIYQAALERQKPVIIHAGTAPYPLGSPFLGLEHMEQVLARWPNLKAVIPHLGYYELDRALDLVERFPHLYLDTSWVLGRTDIQLPRQKLAAFMERFPDRFLYGSDFPILDCQAENGLNDLLQLGLTRSTLKMVLTTNARRLVGQAGRIPHTGSK